jgi:hypothetical protein
MARGYQHDLGELRARIAAVESEMQGLRQDVREIRDALIGLRGGWRLLTILIAVSASLGAAAGKLLLATPWSRI